MRALAGALVCGIGLAASAAAGSGSVGCRWQVVLDRPGTGLTAVAAVSDRDVWAVGDASGRGVILHWNGRAWRSEPSAVLPLDVAAVSRRDVWVVGSASPAAAVTRPRSAHWDGRRWRLVPTPGGPGAYLRGVGGDVWAVGAAGTGALLLRWAGRAWRSAGAEVPVGLLHGVDPPWAVGTHGVTGSTRSEDPLVMHLRGGHWEPVATPRLDSVDENLLAVDAVSPGEVWAVGSADVLGGRAPLVQRLHDGAWRDESVAGLPTVQSALLGVAALGPNDVWVAGYRGFTAQRTLLAHWDGRRWTQAPSRPGSLVDLSALSPHEIWAVGSNGGSGLVERLGCA